MQHAKRKPAASSDTLKKDTQVMVVSSPDMQISCPLCCQPFCDHTCVSILPCCQHSITAAYRSQATCFCHQLLHSSLAAMHIIATSTTTCRQDSDKANCQTLQRNLPRLLLQCSMGALYTVITRNLCCSLCQAKRDSSFKGSAKKKQKTAMQAALCGLQDGNNGAKEIQIPQAKTAYLVSQVSGSCM